ncbi:engulfment and cell motility protein 2-like [Branchiostoma floridae x Branchiostoma belcheri]
MPVSKDIVKLAVEMPGRVAQFLDFNQRRPLPDIIAKLCDHWGLESPEEYALQYSDGSQAYITEKNRAEIKNGAILRLTTSPSKTVREILVLPTKDALMKLARGSSDTTFATEFVYRNGVPLLVDMVVEGTATGEALAYILTAFLQFMDHGILPWKQFSDDFIRKIIGYVLRSTPAEAMILQRSLAILECAILSSEDLYKAISAQITVEEITLHFKSPVPEVQLNAVALINALWLRSSKVKAREIGETLQFKYIRAVMLNYIIRGRREVSSEMAHQLHVLQVLMMNLNEDRMYTKINPSDTAHLEKLYELSHIAFGRDSDSEAFGSSTNPGGNARTQARKGRGVSDRAQLEFKKLGFSNLTNPLMDFTKRPPGVLALDCIVYFAANYPDSFTRLVLENSCRQDNYVCPFARTSIDMTKLLCKMLKIGELPSETGTEYYPMLFTQESPLEELFCICIQLLNKTWREMRAMDEDYDKVMDVVREQMTLALSEKPDTMDRFRAILQELDYHQIIKILQDRRASMLETNTDLEPFCELREDKRPEVLDLVRKHRLNALVEGTIFNKVTTRRSKDKFWYCRLAPNHKCLHWGDVPDSAKPPLPVEMLPEMLPVSDIKGLAVGKECPHIMKEGKKEKKESLAPLAFSVLYDPDASLNFLAPNDYVYDLWTDGIRALLEQEMTSELAQKDMEILLGMEMKLALLDTEGIPVPNQPPPIPDDPKDYNFCCE